MKKIAVLILWLLHFLPLPMLAVLGNVLGLLVYPIAG